MKLNEKDKRLGKVNEWEEEGTLLVRLTKSILLIPFWLYHTPYMISRLMSDR